MINHRLQHIYEFDCFRVEVGERLLLREGEVVPLQPRVFDTLVALVENSGHLLEKDELMARLWSDTFVEEATLAHNISDLRKALGDTPTGKKYIETVAKRGYRFTAAVKQLPNEMTTLVLEKYASSRLTIEELEKTPAGLEASHAPVVVVADKRRRVRWQVVAIWLGSAALLGGLVAWIFYPSARQRAANLELANVKAIAVLPFQAVVEQERDEALELGMSDTLITRLSNLERIVVRPTSAVMKYNNTKRDWLTIGRELQVDSLLDGHIQKTGDRVRVSVQLVSVKDGHPLWADKFDAKFTDLFAVQDAISEQIARALSLRLTSRQQEQLTKRYTDNIEAYEDYTKGRFFWNKRDPQSYQRAIDYFNKAISLDPNYALAYVGLADCYMLLSPQVLDSPAASFLKAKEAAMKALELDDSLAEAHASLAHILYLYEWNWAKAEGEFQRAIELNPNYATGHEWYANFLSSMGRHDEAIATATRAKELDPVSLPVARDVARVYYHARRYDEAIAAWEKTFDLDPNNYRLDSWLEKAYEKQGRYDKVLENRLRAMQIVGLKKEDIAPLEQSYRTKGWKGYWQKELELAEARARQRYVSPYPLVKIYARLGDKEKAFEYLQRAYDEHADNLTLLKVDPILDDLRGDQRFQDLLRRVGFRQ